MKVVWQGNEQLRPYLTPLVRLHTDPKNARRHDQQNIEAIKESFKRFGQQLPLIALKTGKVIVGNGRLIAVRDGWPGEEKWTHIATFLFEREEEAATALAIIDNRSGELASWDYEQLGATMKQLIEVGWQTQALGWLAPQAQPLLAGEWVPLGRTAGQALLDAPQLGRPVQLTVVQRMALDKAVARMREVKKQPEMAEGAVVGALAKEYMSASGNLPGSAARGVRGAKRVR